MPKYVPLFVFLARGWCSLIFPNKEDTNKVLYQEWMWGLSRLIIKRCDPKFNSLTEPHYLQKNQFLMPRRLGFFGKERF